MQPVSQAIKRPQGRPGDLLRWVCRVSTWSIPHSNHRCILRSFLSIIAVPVSTHPAKKNAGFRALTGGSVTFQHYLVRGPIKVGRPSQGEERPLPLKPAPTGAQPVPGFFMLH